MNIFFKHSLILCLFIFFGQSIMIGQSTIPLPEHPRPDFNRSIWKNLNGMWDFRFDPNNIGLIEKLNLG